VVVCATVPIPCEDCGAEVYTHYLRSDGKWVCASCIPETERGKLFATVYAIPKQPWYRRILETLIYGLELLHKRLLGGGKDAR